MPVYVTAQCELDLTFLVQESGLTARGLLSRGKVVAFETVMGRRTFSDHRTTVG